MYSSSDGSSLPINDLENAILDYVEKNPRATISNIASETGASKSGVDRAVSKLKALGLLSRTGTKSAGVWTVRRN